jgi:DNA-binding MarR family transcriptional regulator
MRQSSRSGKPAASAAPAMTPARRAALELHTLQDLRTVVGSARRHDSHIRRATGIAGSQLWALAEVALATGITVNALARRLALHQTTASNLVNALVERGLIRRRRDRRDQRLVHLHVTASGARMLSRAPRPHSGPLVDALRRIAARDLDALAHSLATLLGAMRQAAPTVTGDCLLVD